MVHLLAVALRKESVDRNSKNPMICVNEIPSLSARRAWIEMDWASVITAMTSSLSARRAWIEISIIKTLSDGILSLSARRAWIEIYYGSPCYSYFVVALRKESVDRNRSSLICVLNR